MPPVGIPNAPASSSLLNSSAVVPSKAVVSMPCQVDPMPSSTSARTASGSNTCRITCSPSSARAFDSAGPAGTVVPGLRPSPGRPKLMRRVVS